MSTPVPEPRFVAIYVRHDVREKIIEQKKDASYNEYFTKKLHLGGKK